MLFRSPPKKARPAQAPKQTQDRPLKQTQDRPSAAGASTSTARSGSKRRATPDYSSSDEDSVYDSMDEGDCKEILRPVKRELKRLKIGTDHLSREDKVSHLKECLSAIGSRIEYTANLEKTSEAKERRRKHLCEPGFVPLPLAVADLVLSQGFGRRISSRRRFTGPSSATCTSFSRSTSLSFV